METFPGVRREMIGKDSSQIVCFPNTWQRRKLVMVARCAAVKVQFPLSLKCTGFLSMSTVFLDRSAHISIIFPSQIGKSCDDKCVISALNFSGSQVFSVFKEWLLFKVYYASIVHLCTLHSLQWHRS